MGRFEDLTGRRFGRLTAVAFEFCRGSHAYWRCKCDCGGHKVARASHLKTGNVSSCGCAKTRRTHGETHSRLYVIWNDMKQRCANPKSMGFHRYGGRGIAVCKEWQNSFEAFRDWALANGYREDLSIERKDNNGPYCSENCRWATRKEQANNTRKTRFLTYNGETHSVSEWARIMGIKQSTLSMRLNKYNWSVEDALNKGGRENVS